MIGIRVDANNQIATGHLMRCMTIAKELKKLGEEIIFISADNNPEDFIKRNNFQFLSLNLKWDDMDSEVNRLYDVIESYSIDKLIIDSYFVTESYLRNINNKCKVIYIDDMNFFKYPVSMLVNYNIYCDEFNYHELYNNTKTRLYLGCQYAPLRTEFQNIVTTVREQIKRILITTGGTDNFNIAGQLLEKINGENLFSDVEFHVLCGNFNINIDELKILSKRSHNIHICQNVANVAGLMCNSDLAITAGGSTMYELCACGVPTICFSFADNQLHGVKSFSKKGIMTYVGDIREDNLLCISRIIKEIQYYITNKEERQNKSRAMNNVVDGFGAERIAVEVLCL